MQDHLVGVAELASVFGASFDAANWLTLAGLWHDLGKFRPGFQRYIQQVGGAEAHIEGKIANREKSHSAAGALWAEQLLFQKHGEAGRLAARILGYLIAGHHAGLDDWIGGLEARLSAETSKTEFAEAKDAAQTDILEPALDFDLDLRKIPGNGHGVSLWIRMLFSCLVDADFLDTEAYFDSARSEKRKGFPTIEAMLRVFNQHMAEIAGNAKPTPVNTLRADILRQCREKAALPPGLFSLTVPTGGGKTLSSLAFALQHAQAFGKQRIIYAIPYTSIIEQTAGVFRRVFQDLGEEVLVEHHSQADADTETSRSRIACENWDAPLIVTTNVQLFESLFAAKTSRCRKLHNLINSVIVLDEAQQLPPEFLQPILDTLNLLVRHYGVTVVLCTATQPALSSTRYFDASHNLRGLENVREIMEAPGDLYAQLKRVQIHLPADWNQATSWQDVAGALSAEDCALAIVNTRKAARELHQLMPAGTLHLSALMCGAHRAAVIQHIRERLRARREGADTEPLRVVSTQLVEAGVDIDFPVVWRALAGLDSIAQAAGRCNREGLLGANGKVVVFVPPEQLPPSTLRKAGQSCISTLFGIDDGDPMTPDLFESYFRRFYAAMSLDKHNICGLLRLNTDSAQTSKLIDALYGQHSISLLKKIAEKLNDTFAIEFRTAADKFQFIEDGDRVPVIVRYADKLDDIDMLLNLLHKEGPQRWLMRKLQRYTISIHDRHAQKLVGRGLELSTMPGLYVQTADALYDSQTGFFDSDIPFSPSACTI